MLLLHLRSNWERILTDWTWDKVHTLEHPHPIGQVEALRSFFNVGPFPVNGTREVINNMYFPYGTTGYYETSSGPSTRRVIDFSDVENSLEYSAHRSVRKSFQQTLQGSGGNVY